MVNIINQGAKTHTQIMEKAISNLRLLGKEIQSKRGLFSLIGASELLALLSSSKVFNGAEQEILALAANDIADLIQMLPKFAEQERAILSHIETNLQNAADLDEMSQMLKSFLTAAGEKSVLAPGLLFSIEILNQGRKTIYSPKWVMKQLEIEPTAQSAKDVGKAVLAIAGRDVLGGVAGAAGGAASAAAVSWWSGPGTGVTVPAGAIGGATSVGVGISVIATFDKLYDWMYPPIIHGPNDPNGPIGPQRPPQE